MLIREINGNLKNKTLLKSGHRKINKIPKNQTNHIIS